MPSSPPAGPQRTEVADYYATIHPGPQYGVPSPFAEAVRKLETSLGIPIWLLIQHGHEAYDEIGDAVREAIFEARGQMLANKPLGVLVDSPGGYTRSAYQIATILRARCGGFTAIVPRSAASAATLLVLGAQKILLNKNAELGLLDAQMLKAAEEYVIRLLIPQYSLDEAAKIAKRLVGAYPDHDFVIDAEGLVLVGLEEKYAAPSNEQIALMDSIVPYLGQRTMLGRLERISTPGALSESRSP